MPTHYALQDDFKHNQGKLHFLSFQGENLLGEGKKTAQYLVSDMQHSVYVSLGAGVISQIDVFVLILL